MFIKLSLIMSQKQISKNLPITNKGSKKINLPCNSAIIYNYI